MEYEQISGKKKFRPFKHWQIGDSIEATFQSTSEDDYGKENYEVKILSVDFKEQTVKTKNKKGEPVEYEAPEVGETFVLNSCGSLDKAMEKCDFGDTIKVVYGGTSVLKSGKFAGKDSHSLEVFRKSNKQAPVKKTEVAEDDAL